MPAALLRNALARGLWQAGCWLQLAARRLEVAGPATAPPEPLPEDAPVADALVEGLRPPGLPGLPGLPGFPRMTASPPAHWQRLLDGREPRQLHTAPQPATAAAVPATHAPAPATPARAPAPELTAPPALAPAPASATSAPALAHATTAPTLAHAPSDSAPAPVERTPAPAHATSVPAPVPSNPTPALAPHDAAPVPAGRDPQRTHRDRYSPTPLHTDLVGQGAAEARAGAASGAEVGACAAELAVERWPSLPDDTPLWTPEWLDPTRTRTARLDEEQRGTPWSG